MNTEEKGKDMTEERVLTLALSPKEAQLISVLFAFGVSLLKGAYPEAAVIGTGAAARLLRLSVEECLSL